MNKRFLIAFFSMSFVLTVSLFPQSLTELAKKEKERREALKGKSSVVITNENLSKIKIKPAIEVTTSGEEETENQAQTSQASTPPPETSIVQAPPAQEQALTEKDFKAKLADLKAKVDQAQEIVELLGLKMNALWQQFYSMDDMRSRDSVQIQISETYDKLLKAQETAEKTQAELDDFMATARRQGIPEIWIR